MKTRLNFDEIFAAATIEQKIIWNDIYLKYGERISIVPYSFTGLLAGADLNTYVARRMFLAYSVHFSGAQDNAEPRISLFDEANAVNFVYANNAAYWDVTGIVVRYLPSSQPYENCLTSRFSATYNAYIDFTGFRLTF